MRPRATARKWLGELDAAMTQCVVDAVSDVTLVVDSRGRIRHIAVGNEVVEGAPIMDWVGQPWIDTVKPESRATVVDLLHYEGHLPRPRKVIHVSTAGRELPILYSTIRIAPSGQGHTASRTMAFGRDLRGIEAQQLRLIEAQHAMDSLCLRLRQAESRYQHLFQTSSEAMLIVDADGLRILDASPGAVALVSGDGGPRSLVGGSMVALFEEQDAKPLLAAVAAAHAGRRADVKCAALTDGGRQIGISLSAFRQGDASVLLARLSRLGAQPVNGGSTQESPMLLDFVSNTPDALVFTDADGRIQSANPAFVAMTQLGSEEQARGERLDHWIGSSGVELDVMIQTVRHRGNVKLFSTLLRGEDGANIEVEVSVSATMNNGKPMLAFAVRDVGRRLSAESRRVDELPRSTDELTSRIGRVPMKDIVGETTDLIERLCIEKALKMTSNNRATAAQMLGLSRQSLYVKLRQHGFAMLRETDG